MSRCAARPCAGLVAVFVIVTLAGAAMAQESRVQQARTLLVAWNVDPTRVDRARELLEADVADSPSVDALVELSGAWVLTGDFRGRSDAERQAAYREGARAAQRAIAMAPDSERAHLLLAYNSGRSAEITGMMHALSLVGTIRSESETVLRLNPSSVGGLVLAGGLAAGLPKMMGGDRGKAEQFFTRALTIDPHETGGRLEFAKLYVAQNRWAEAARQLQTIIADDEPTDRPRWVMSDLPRAREMLFELRERGRVPGLPPQSP